VQSGTATLEQVSMAENKLIQIDELTPGEIRPIEIEGRQLLLVNGEKGPALIERFCPHAGGDLAKGKVVANRIKCPTHSYLFDLKTGSCPLGRREGWGPAKVYKLHESDGYLCVEFSN
jgi:nitrite reductase/ring-hydroxylating ferredoxin subunit